jgi:hypothetical protein
MTGVELDYTPDILIYELINYTLFLRKWEKKLKTCTVVSDDTCKPGEVYIYKTPFSETVKAALVGPGKRHHGKNPVIWNEVATDRGYPVLYKMTEEREAFSHV